MLVFERVDTPGPGDPPVAAVVRLPFERRRVSRQRVRLEDGREAGIRAPRGTVLRAGDVLVSACGERVRVEAAREPLSVLRGLDPAAQARAAYHLGNRHAFVMLGAGSVAYPADPVSDRMFAALGLAVVHESAPFEPEGGAFEFLATDARLALLGSRPGIRPPGAGQGGDGRTSPADAAPPGDDREAGPGEYAVLPERAAARPAVAPSAPGGTDAMPPRSFLRLLRLVSPALPVGAFAYSQGLEWAVAAGSVRTAQDLGGWLGGVLAGGLATLELPLAAAMRRAWNAGDAQAALALGDELLAWRDSAEARQEERRMGAALARILAAEGVEAARACLAGPDAGRVTYLGMFALAAAAWDIPERECLLAYAWAWLENQVTAGVKLVPLGQTDAQRILSALTGAAAEAVEAAPARGTKALSSSLPGRGLAQMLHETQDVRLFRS